MEKYLVRKLLDNFPDVLEVKQDMPSIEQGKSVIFTRLVADLKKLEDTLHILEELHNDEMKSALQSKPFDPQSSSGSSNASNAGNRIDQSLNEGNKLYADAKDRLEMAQKDFASLCFYFGELDAVNDPDRLFSKILNFLLSLDKVITELSTSKRKKYRNVANEDAA